MEKRTYYLMLCGHQYSNKNKIKNILIGREISYCDNNY